MPYTEKAHLGKFEGCYSQWVAEVLYDICGISGYSDQVGDVEGYGWYALIHGNRWAWIVREDSQGFFDYEEFPDGLSADDTWNRILDDYDAWRKECDDYELDA